MVLLFVFIYIYIIGAANIIVDIKGYPGPPNIPVEIQRYRGVANILEDIQGYPGAPDIPADTPGKPWGIHRACGSLQK
jgi:hypothetical protein